MHMVFLFRLNSGGRRGYALYILEYEMHCTQLSIMPREACAHWASTRCVREDCKSSLRIHTRCVAVWAAMHASWVGVVFTSRYLGRCVAVFARRIPLLCNELSWVAAYRLVVVSQPLRAICAPPEITSAAAVPPGGGPPRRLIMPPPAKPPPAAAAAAARARTSGSTCAAGRARPQGSGCTWA